MQPKILSLLEMLELNSILSKYVEKEYSEDSIEFVHSILEKVKANPVDYLFCISIMTGLAVEEMKQEDFMDYLTCFVDGLSINKYVEFMDVSEKLGNN